MVMRALGEMAVRHPVSGSFGQYASRYLGPLAGFVTGWTYVFEMAIVAIADVTAFSIYMGFWFPAGGPLDLDPGHHLLPGRTEPAQREGLRRAGVLVLADQGGGHHRHDRRRRRHYRLRFPGRRVHRGAGPGQPRGARRAVPQRLRGPPGLVRRRDVRVRRDRDARHHRRRGRGPQEGHPARRSTPCRSASCCSTS